MNTPTARWTLLLVGSALLALLVPYALFFGIEETRSLYDRRYGFVPEPFVRFAFAHLIFWTGSWAMVGAMAVSYTSYSKALAFNWGQGARLGLLTLGVGILCGLGISLLLAAQRQMTTLPPIGVLASLALALLLGASLVYAHALRAILGLDSRFKPWVFALQILGFWLVAGLSPLVVLMLAIAGFPLFGYAVLGLPFLALVPAYAGLGWLMSRGMAV